MKIVILSEYDWCGSGLKIRNALRSKGHRAILVKNNNLNGFDCDFETPKHTVKRGQVIIQSPRMSKAIQQHLFEADAVIFKGDEPPTKSWHKYIIPGDAKIIFLASGSNFRRDALTPSAAKAKWSLADYKLADIKLVNTPEMAYPGFSWMPMSFDSDEKPNLFTRENRQRKKLIIMHSPSNRSRKGTDIFIHAMSILRAKGYNFKCHIIEGKPVDLCIKIKSGASLFYDQNRVGWYGNSAIEAMQYGIPTLAWIKPAARDKAIGLGRSQDLPVIDTGTNIQDMVRAFETYLQNPGKLYRLSQRTKKYCDRMHSYRSTADLWEEVLSAL